MPFSSRTIILLVVLFSIAVTCSFIYHAAPSQLLALHLGLITLLGFAFVLWLSSDFPHGVAALAILLLAHLLRLDGDAPIFAGFSQDAFFFLIAVLFVGVTLSISGLAMRLCQKFLQKEGNLTGVDFLWRVPLFLLLFSAVVSSATARVSLLQPVTEGILTRSNTPGLSKYLSIYVAHTSTLSSRAFLSGGPGIIVAADLMSRAGYPLNWFQWLIWMGIPVLLIIVLSTLLHWLWLKPESYTFPVEEPQALSRTDQVLLFIMTIMILLWMFGAWLGVSPTEAALLGMIGIALVSHERMQVIQQLDWDLVIFSGATLSFAYVLLETGTAAWIGELLFNPISQLSGTPVLVLLVMLALMLLRFPLSNGVSYSAVVFPIILSLDPIGRLEPLHLAFMALLAGALAFLPVQSMPSMLTYASRRFGISDTMASGGIMFFATVVVVQFFALHYWSWLQK